MLRPTAVCLSGNVPGCVMVQVTIFFAWSSPHPVWDTCRTPGSISLCLSLSFPFSLKISGVRDFVHGIDNRPRSQRVLGTIPIKGICPGAGLGPECGASRRQPVNDSQGGCFSLSPSPFHSEINENILWKTKIICRRMHGETEGPAPVYTSLGLRCGNVAFAV